jgi:hypothetical protein
MSETTLPNQSKAPIGRLSYPVVNNDKSEPVTVNLYSVMSTVNLINKKGVPATEEPKHDKSF